MYLSNVCSDFRSSRSSSVCTVCTFGSLILTAGPSVAQKNVKFVLRSVSEHGLTEQS